MTPKELRDMRDRLAISQRCLAERLGVNGRTVRRWEAGDHPIKPSVAFMVRAMAAQTSAGAPA